MPCDQNSIPALTDRLTGALIGLARATDGNEHLINPSATAAVLEGLAATALSADVTAEQLSGLLTRVTEEKRNMVPDCFLCTNPCGRTDDYDMKHLLDASDEVFRRKLRLLSGARKLATSLLRYSPTRPEKELEGFLYKALILVGMDEFSEEALGAAIPELEGWLRSCS